MDTETTEIARHPIRVVARRTGLSPAVLRAWEKRYSVVEPSRTEGGQRLYSDEDVRRLGLLRQVLEEGRSISQVAELSLQELQELVKEDDAERRGPVAPASLAGASASDFLNQAFSAVDAMNPETLERVLARSALALPIPTLLDQVVVPLLGRIGSSWKDGGLGPAHEHLSTVVIRRFLEWVLRSVGVPPEAPVVLSATPAGERHELGALLSAVTAAAEGWKGVFLGPDLPADEIAAAALKQEAEVVALSAVDPALAEALPTEVGDLRSRLPSYVHIVLGGPSALISRAGLEGGGVEVLGSLEDFRGALRRRWASGKG